MYGVGYERQYAQAYMHLSRPCAHGHARGAYAHEVTSLYTAKSIRVNVSACMYIDLAAYVTAKHASVRMCMYEYGAGNCGETRTWSRAAVLAEQLKHGMHLLAPGSLLSQERLLAERGQRLPYIHDMCA